MFWSSVSIGGKPTILVVDASRNLEGWEFEFCDRLFTAMRRRGLLVHGSVPVRVEAPEALAQHLKPDTAFNCILLLVHGEGKRVSQEAKLRSYWTWLNSGVLLGPKLFAACTWQSYDPVASREILESTKSFAPLALAPQSSLTPREAGLFFLKFFTELELHSASSITGKMVWFSSSKAKALLQKRRLMGKVEARC